MRALFAKKFLFHFRPSLQRIRNETSPPAPFCFQIVVLILPSRFADGNACNLSHSITILWFHISLSPSHSLSMYPLSLRLFPSRYEVAVVIRLLSF